MLVKILPNISLRAASFVVRSLFWKTELADGYCAECPVTLGRNPF